MSSSKAALRLRQVSSQLQSHKSLLASEIQKLLSKGQDDVAAREALSAFLQPPRYKANAEQRMVLEQAVNSIVAVEEIDIQTYTWNGNASSTIIVTHGFGTSAAFLAPSIKHLLSTTKHRIVAVDHAAHGESAGSKASLGHFISVLKTMVDREHQAGNSISALIGHSVGATALIMLVAKEVTIFQSATRRPCIVAINPPLQSITLMQGFCIQHSMPLSLVDGMRAAFIPAPEDVLGKHMVEGDWICGLRVLIVQDDQDKVAKPKETEQLASRFRANGADETLMCTHKLGHFKPVGDSQVLRSIEAFL